MTLSSKPGRGRDELGKRLSEILLSDLSDLSSSNIVKNARFILRARVRRRLSGDARDCYHCLSAAGFSETDA